MNWFLNDDIIINIKQSLIQSYKKVILHSGWDYKQLWATGYSAIGHGPFVVHGYMLQPQSNEMYCYIHTHNFSRHVPLDMPCYKSLGYVWFNKEIKEICSPPLPQRAPESIHIFILHVQYVACHCWLSCVLLCCVSVCNVPHFLTLGVTFLASHVPLLSLIDSGTLDPSRSTLPTK